jgi:hypothetical protein
MRNDEKDRVAYLSESNGGRRQVLSAEKRGVGRDGERQGYEWIREFICCIWDFKMLYFGCIISFRPPVS